MSWHTKRLMKKLVTCAFPQEQADVAHAQIADIVDFHIASFTTSKPVGEQMRVCAFDCYVQGLLDGAQVAQGGHLKLLSISGESQS